MKVLDAWALPYSTVIKRSDGLGFSWGSGFWNSGIYMQSSNKFEVDYGDVVDYQVQQDSHFWLKSDGTLWGAGVNYNGELGIGIASSYEYKPKIIASGIKSFSVGGMGMNNVFVLALKTDGSVIAWGWNESGQLGIGNKFRKISPVAVPLPGVVTQISCGYIHSLALLEDGRVFGWGHNNYRVLGPITQGMADPIITSPIEIKKLSNISSLNAGAYLSFFITANGSIYALGTSHYGNIGNGQQGGTWEYPIAISIGSAVKDIRTLEMTTFGLTQEGALYSWGRNLNGILGIGTNSEMAFIPQKVADQVKEFGVGRFHAWYIDSDGTLWNWGSNENWQLGRENQEKYSNIPEFFNWGGAL
jgi:alpha-tubulin suppressor-like RCC1 family protein